MPQASRSKDSWVELNRTQTAESEIIFPMWPQSLSAKFLPPVLLLLYRNTQPKLTATSQCTGTELAGEQRVSLKYGFVTEKKRRHWFLFQTLCFIPNKPKVCQGYIWDAEFKSIEIKPLLACSKISLITEHNIRLARSVVREYSSANSSYCVFMGVFLVFFFYRNDIRCGTSVTLVTH